MRDDGFKLFIWIFAAIIGLGGCGVGGCVGCNSCQTADSVMTGQVMHYGVEGVVWKTRDGSISKGFTSGGTGTVSQQDECFSVEAGYSDIESQVERARDTGKPVKLYYHQFAVPFPWRAGCDKIIYRIEFVDPQQGKP